MKTVACSQFPRDGTLIETCQLPLRKKVGLVSSLELVKIPNKDYVEIWTGSSHKRLNVWSLKSPCPKATPITVSVLVCMHVSSLFVQSPSDFPALAIESLFDSSPISFHTGPEAGVKLMELASESYPSDSICESKFEQNIVAAVV